MAVPRPLLLCGMLAIAVLVYHEVLIFRGATHHRRQSVAFMSEFERHGHSSLSGKHGGRTQPTELLDDSDDDEEYLLQQQRELASLLETMAIGPKDAILVTSVDQMSVENHLPLFLESLENVGDASLANRLLVATLGPQAHSACGQMHSHCLARFRNSTGGGAGAGGRRLASLAGTVGDIPQGRFWPWGVRYHLGTMRSQAGQVRPHGRHLTGAGGATERSQGKKRRRKRDGVGSGSRKASQRWRARGRPSGWDKVVLMWQLAGLERAAFFVRVETVFFQNPLPTLEGVLADVQVGQGTARRPPDTGLLFVRPTAPAKLFLERWLARQQAYKAREMAEFTTAWTSMRDMQLTVKLLAFDKWPTGCCCGFPDMITSSEVNLTSLAKSEVAKWILWQPQCLLGGLPLQRKALALLNVWVPTAAGFALSHSQRRLREAVDIY
eukprot:jgi/Botrbrau1/10474/Bobra.0133s0080.1